MRAALLFAVLGLVSLVPMASAQTPESPPKPPPKPPPQVFTTFKPDDVAAILREAGYRAEVVHANNRYRIRTGMGGRQVLVKLYCEADNCGSLTWELAFSASPQFTLSFVNKWNRDWRYSKAYIDTDGGAVVQYDVAFNGGITREAIGDAARRFDSIVGEFDNAMKNAK